VGRLLLTWRLIVRDVRRHPGETVMFLLAVTVATATLALGTATTNAVSTGYAKTRAATAGPDVMATTSGPNPSGLASRLARVPGVAALGGPFFAFDTAIQAHGRAAHSAVEGRGTARSSVDQPLVTSGSWVRPGGAVLERGFAQALGVRIGERVTVNGRSYPVVGTAISAATSVYPWSDPAQVGPSDPGGTIWLTTADAHAASGGAPGVYLIYLKLTDPAAAEGFAKSAAVLAIEPDGWPDYHYWQDVLATDAAIIEFTRPTLVIGGWLLAVAAIVTLAALATVRASRDLRRAALLKAVGAGPVTVTAVLLAQYLLLTVLAAGFGLAGGTLTAPRLADPSAGLLDTAGLPDSATASATLLLAVLVAVTGALGPVVRTARTSAIRALADPAHPLTHHPHLNALTAYLPTPLLLGIRLLARRPGRAALAATGTTATTIMVTAMLAWHADLNAAPASLRFGPVEVRNDQTGHVLLAVTLALVALSTLNRTLVLPCRSAWSVMMATVALSRKQSKLSTTACVGAAPSDPSLPLVRSHAVNRVPGSAPARTVSTRIVQSPLVSRGPHAARSSPARSSPAMATADPTMRFASRMTRPIMV